MGKCQHFIDLCHLSIYLSIWHQGNCGRMLYQAGTSWRCRLPWRLVYSWEIVSNYQSDFGRMSQSISSIYRSGIAEIAGERTRREPPNNIDSISSQYPSIYTTLGKTREDVPGGNLPKILSSILFQLPNYLSIWHWGNPERMYQEETSRDMCHQWVSYISIYLLT
jgi:hypothetical protein